MKQQKLFKTKRQPRLSALLLGYLTLCLFFISACGAINGGSSSVNVDSPAPIPTPAIDASMKQQGDMQLQTFQHWIALMKQYGGNTTTYQQQYDTDQQALQSAQKEVEYKTALTTLNSHVEAIKLPTMKAETQNLQQQLQQQVTAWGQNHQYYDSYDNTHYPLGFEYGTNGIGGWVQESMDSAQTMADYQQTIEDLQMYLTNFQAMKANSDDKTPYNQPHKADMQLMQHYDKANSRVLVVSLSEQAMRVYENGNLAKAFLVTTGRPTLPSPPGAWWVEGKKAPTVFKSGVKPGDPGYYPDTPINFAIQYHSNGYFIHDSWWRSDYGPGTNFPHADSSGDPFSAQGSHGCVNLSKENAGWVYNYVQLFTGIIIY